MWSSSAQGYTVISSNTREVAEAPHEITQNMKSYSHPPPLPPPRNFPLSIQSEMMKLSVVE